MNTWAPIWSPVVDSSLWEESGDVVKVFMTILATKDSDHVCRLDAYRIGKKCNFFNYDRSVDEVKVLEILKLLASPDTRRKTKQEYDGRRIRAVEDGWFVLNGEKYREMVRKEQIKAKNRRSQASFRARAKLLVATNAPGPERTPEELEALAVREAAAHEAVKESVQELNAVQRERMD